MVILCDYKMRKFQHRIPPPGEVILPRLELIEDALHQSKTKLNAAHARSRIKARVLNLDSLLPDSLQENDRIGARMYVVCWFNLAKARYPTEVLCNLI